jgi:hypothetical protein
LNEEEAMHRAHRLSPEQARFELAKAERANFIVSLAIGDQELLPQALEALESAGRGTSMLWPEFLRWESSRRAE